MSAADRTDIVIVGAGPVGLLLGCLLLRRGIGCRILEQRAAAAAHSRSIGIHPVALEIFDELGIAERFVALGHRIERGQAYVNRCHVGTISFARCRPPFPFILTLPQYRTEALLEHHLRELDPGALLRGAEAVGCRLADGEAAVAYRRDGETAQVDGRCIVGCDGAHSFVRRAAEITFNGAAYPDAYVMGDFKDAGARADAAVYLHQEGLVESFPLPDRRRRWVVKTGTLLPECRREDIVTRVRNRLGIDLSGCEHFMLSAFAVQHHLATTFAKGCVALAGDAAHVISPIGGQGMNLGWLDARHLAPILAALVRNEVSAGEALRRYSRTRRRAAEKARRRGEFNMALGRRFSHPRLRRVLIRAMLARPSAARMANLFTMRGL
ncbi:MAG TPA: FAD-dependent monooxygenase [Woeseiaceae bacterium]|nr:FAD-dependent monooxygenase [Woeseiaceae bacterium]